MSATTVGAAIQAAIDCPECMAWFDNQPHLVASCASVGIEHGRSTQYMLAIMLDRYHVAHQERRP